MADTVHRIWDFRGDMAAIAWFQKEPDGSARVLQGHVNSGQPLIHYAGVAHQRGIEVGSVDYVRPDAHVTNLSGQSIFQSLQAFGLNPKVLTAEQWRSPAPFAGGVVA